MSNKSRQIIILSFVISCLPATVSAQHDSQLINYSTKNLSSQQERNVEIIDSDYLLLEALEGIDVPYSIRKKLELVTVTYFGFDDKLHQGQLIVHKSIANEMKEIFDLIRDIRFPIEKVIPLSVYNWSDVESMNDNNTSSFNHRYISGTRILSMHAKGLAIDINPKQNPYIKNNITMPEGAVYNPGVNGTITAKSKLVKIFKERGWEWGGDWKSLKDYQHFQKDID